MKLATASWAANLYVECPHCDAFLDLLNSTDFPNLNDEATLVRTFELGRRYTLEDAELKHFPPIECSDCHKEFKLEELYW